MKILVADDHDLVRDTIALFLENEGGIDVTVAATLDEALLRIDEVGSFDLVLLDYGMPGMDGLAGLKRAIAANQDKPVALMSGVASRTVAVTLYPWASNSSTRAHPRWPFAPVTTTSLPGNPMPCARET